MSALSDEMHAVETIERGALEGADLQLWVGRLVMAARAVGREQVRRAVAEHVWDR